MKLLIYGHKNSEIISLVEKTGFDIVDPSQIKSQFDGVRKIPDMIAVVGGDGTLMKSEKEYPEIPKFILQKSQTSKKGHDLLPEEMLKKLVDKDYRIEDEIKIEAISGEKKIVGLNEIIVHNIDPRCAIRYEIFINGKKVGNEIIGDGVAISTPYGSTGYYRAITDSFFEVGIGVAFNNSTEQSDHMVLKEDSEVVVKITRGKAIAYADNNEEEIILDDTHTILIKKYNKKAKIVKFI